MAARGRRLSLDGGEGVLWVATEVSLSERKTAMELTRKFRFLKFLPWRCSEVLGSREEADEVRM